MLETILRDRDSTTFRLSVQRFYFTTLGHDGCYRCDFLRLYLSEATQNTAFPNICINYYDGSYNLSSILVVISALSTKPAENTEIFIRFWKDKLVRKMDKQWLRSCASIGYSIGFIHDWRKKTGASVIGVIINLGASMSLVRC